MPAVPAPHTHVVIEHLGGAVSRVGEDDDGGRPPGRALQRAHRRDVGRGGGGRAGHRLGARSCGGRCSRSRPAALYVNYLRRTRARTGSGRPTARRSTPGWRRLKNKYDPDQPVPPQPEHQADGLRKSRAGDASALPAPTQRGVSLDCQGLLSLPLTRRIPAPLLVAMAVAVALVYAVTVTTAGLIF